MAGRRFPLDFTEVINLLSGNRTNSNGMFPTESQIRAASLISNEISVLTRGLEKDQIQPSWRKLFGNNIPITIDELGFTRETPIACAALLDEIVDRMVNTELLVSERTESSPPSIFLLYHTVAQNGIVIGMAHLSKDFPSKASFVSARNNKYGLQCFGRAAYDLMKTSPAFPYFIAHFLDDFAVKEEIFEHGKEAAITISNQCRLANARNWMYSSHRPQDSRKGVLRDQAALHRDEIEGYKFYFRAQSGGQNQFIDDFTEYGTRENSFPRYFIAENVQKLQPYVFERPGFGSDHYFGVKGGHEGMKNFLEFFHPGVAERMHTQSGRYSGPRLSLLSGELITGETDATIFDFTQEYTGYTVRINKPGPHHRFERFLFRIYPEKAARHFRVGSPLWQSCPLSRGVEEPDDAVYGRRRLAWFAAFKCNLWPGERAEAQLEWDSQTVRFFENGENNWSVTEKPEFITMELFEPPRANDTTGGRFLMAPPGSVTGGGVFIDVAEVRGEVFFRAGPIPVGNTVLPLFQGSLTRDEFEAFQMNSLQAFREYTIPDEVFLELDLMPGHGPGGLTNQFAALGLEGRLPPTVQNNQPATGHRQTTSTSSYTSSANRQPSSSSSFQQPPFVVDNSNKTDFTEVPQKQRAARVMPKTSKSGAPFGSSFGSSSSESPGFGTRSGGFGRGFSVLKEENGGRAEVKIVSDFTSVDAKDTELEKQIVIAKLDAAETLPKPGIAGPLFEGNLRLIRTAVYRIWIDGVRYLELEGGHHGPGALTIFREMVQALAGANGCEQYEHMKNTLHRVALDYHKKYGSD